jgi:DNA-binding MarR family transcriptional regulator
MGRLAGMLGCHASNVTGLVDRLEARGVVRRQASTDDRRVKVLDLTPEGARLRAQVLRRMTTGVRPLSRLTVRQQRTLVKILEVVIDESSAGATT